MTTAPSKTQSKRVKLTDTYAKGVTLPVAGVEIHWDTECKNFGLRLKKTGASWIVRVKVHGQAYERTIAELSMGMTAATARKIAQERVVEFRNGIDRDQVVKQQIEQERQERLEEITLNQALNRYLECQHKLSERTRADYKYLMDHELLEYKNKPLREITREFAVKMIREIAKNLTKPRTKEDKAEGKRGGRNGARANHAMRLVRALCRATGQGCQNWGKEAQALAKGGSGVSEFPWIESAPKTTELDPEEGHGGAVWHALGARRVDTSADYIKALMLTGCRRNELADLTVSNVNLRQRTLAIPDTKNGKTHIIYMSDQLFDIVESHLKDRKTGADKEADAKVFDRCSEPKKILASVGEEVGVVFTCHSLRKLFAKTCTQVGVPYPVLKACLNHSTKSSNDVTLKHYAHATPGQMRKAWQQVADFYAPRAGVESLNLYRDVA